MIGQYLAVERLLVDKNRGWLQLLLTREAFEASLMVPSPTLEWILLKFAGNIRIQTCGKSFSIKDALLALGTDLLLQTLLHP